MQGPAAEEGDLDEDEDQDTDSEEKLDPADPDYAFAVLERSYTKTITELEQQPELIQYAEEFTKIFEALFKSRENVKALTDKCESLEIRIVDDETQLDAAKQLEKADSKTISELKDQIKYAWRMCDGAHAREQTAQEVIDNLRKQIDGLNAEIEFKNRMGQDEEASELSKHKEGLQRERDKLASEVAKVTEKLNNALSYQEELERRTSQADLKINEFAEQVEEQGGEIDRLKKIKVQLDSEIQEYTATIEKKDTEINGLNETITSLQKALTKMETNFGTQKVQTEKALRDAETTTLKFSKMQDELDTVSYNHERLKKDFLKRANEIRFKEEEIARIKNDMGKFAKTKEVLEQRIHQMEEDKATSNLEKDKLRQTIANMTREIDVIKRSLDLDKRALDHTTREKEIMNKNIIRMQAVAKDHVKLIKIQEQARRKLVSEIDGHVIEGNKKLKQISYLEKERDRLVEEQLTLMKKIEDFMDEDKLKKAEIYDLKKSIAEHENKLRMQLNLFDAVRAERNALMKNLQESNAEASELKTKLKVTTHQTEQLKEDISMKEQQFIKEEIILRKVTKEKENLRVELDNSIENVRSLKQEISEMKAEEKRLHKVILNGDRLIRQQTKDLEQLMNERDILGSQLVRRNDELSLLYEKIKILQTTLHRGEAQYDQRLEDIRLLKVEIRRLRQEKNLLTKTISNMTDLRQELFHLERDLIKERLKCKALEEELQNPMNVHRWRKLEGSDPELYEMLQKLQLLQKRVLKQSEQALERERQLKEAERLYLNLRQVVARQPGPQIVDQLSKTQRALSVNINKMKCLASELNMTELRNNEYKLEVDKLKEELKDVKQKRLRDKKAQEKRLAALQQTTSKTDSSQSSEVIMPKSLEICVDNIESAMAAFAGGATRIELVAALSEGGLTPSPGLLMQIQNSNPNNIPVFCMLRCRGGNFIYSPEEVEIMREDAKILRKYRADGFVFGALLENGDVDMKTSREIIKTCFPLPVTFHRAFDLVRKPTIEIEVIIDLGFTRILTSGKQPTAQLGVKLIKKLMEQVGNRIVIMPGGGITVDNLKFIMDNTEATEYHGSFAKHKISEVSSTQPEEEKSPPCLTDQQLVAQAIEILRNN